jgi:hypothetical protein
MNRDDPMKIFSMTALATTLATAAAAAAFAMPVRAASDATAESAPPKQQTRMATCNKDAVGKKGDERKAFMKQCLSAGKAEATTATTAEKACKTEAKGMRGNARKDFIKECLAKAA